MSCRFVVIFILAVLTVVTAVENNPRTIKKPNSYQYLQTKVGENEFQSFQAGNGVMGVASIAGIASRNGRVSSVSGVKLYPGIQAPVVATSLSTADLTKSSDSRFKYPVSAKVIKSEDGKYASSSINISPGSVSVSSIARSAPSGEKKSIKTFSSGINNLKTPMQPMIKPFKNSPFLQSPFGTRNLNPWVPNYMFRTPYPLRTGYQPGFINPWPYPTFPIMNYWN